MPSRLVALDEGPDIPVDRTMVVVGRHPQCDARLDSIRVSRRHCCMAEDNGEVVVRDLGSTNGIRINGQRVEAGRLRPGDELSIAHIRYRLEGAAGHELTLADPLSNSGNKPDDGHHYPFQVHPFPAAEKVNNSNSDNPLAAAVREMLPAGVADKCRIQVIVQVPPPAEVAEAPEPCGPDSSP
jgi:predicted component of type VI protein secretion system